MRRFILHQFPKSPKTYASIIISSFFAVIAIYLFIKFGDYMQSLFNSFYADRSYLLFVVSPFVFAFIVFIDKKYFKYAGGSGIPQLIAANDSRNKVIRSTMLSFQIAIVKIIFVCLAMLSGASVSFGGPSVHIGGSIFYNFAALIKLKRKLLIHSVIAIGGCAGLIVAFNAPIAGLMFAYEEIGRKLKKQALVLIGISCMIIYLFFDMYFSNNYYLKDLSYHSFELKLIWQVLPIAIICGIFGGIFAKISISLITKLMFEKTKKIIIIALIMGITVAFMNFISDNQTAGTGQKETLMMLNGESFGLDFVLFKYIATLASFVSTIAGGLFMTSITIGGGLGFEISALYSNISPQVIMIMAMISYLSGVIRAPLTSAFLVLEMTNSLNLLFPAIIVSFLASIVSKQISNRPLYETIASNYLILTSKH